MSKFCQRCGKAFADNMSFCDNCGTPLQAAPQQAAPQQPQYQAPQQPQYQAPQQPQYQAPQQPQYQAPQQPSAVDDVVAKVKVAGAKAKVAGEKAIGRVKTDKKLQTTIIGAVAGVVVLIIAIVLLVNLTGYKPVMNTVIDVWGEGKVDKVEKLAPKEFWEYREDEYDSDVDDYIDDNEDSIEELIEAMEDEYGDNFRITFKVEDEKKLKDKHVEGVGEALEDAYDLNEKKVTAVKEVEFEVSIKGSDDDDDFDLDMYFVKYNGKWYPINYEKNGKEYRAYFNMGSSLYYAILNEMN